MTYAAPKDGRPAKAPGSARLVGIDGNAWAVLGTTDRLLKEAGATKEFREVYLREAKSADYGHLLRTSVAFLDVQAERPDQSTWKVQPDGADDPSAAACPVAECETAWAAPDAYLAHLREVHPRSFARMDAEAECDDCGAAWGTACDMDVEH